MTAIPDERVLEIYNALRPNASHRTSSWPHLPTSWRASTRRHACADLVREAADVYERRDILASRRPGLTPETERR